VKVIHNALPCHWRGGDGGIREEVGAAVGLTDDRTGTRGMSLRLPTGQGTPSCPHSQKNAAHKRGSGKNAPTGQRIPWRKGRRLIAPDSCMNSLIGWVKIRPWYYSQNTVGKKREIAKNGQ
jgi:hypothetical protein